jgi:ketosteroid isomerase-like protein
MSLDLSTRLIEDYLDALVQRRDFARYFAEDVVWTTIETGEEVRGREAVRDHILLFHTRLFDATPEVRTLTVGEDTAVLEADLVGVHTGELAGIAPTGARVRLPYCIAYDLGEEGITACRAYIPLQRLLAQLRPTG